MPRPYLFALLLTCMANPVFAGIVVYEGFNYSGASSGQLTAQTGAGTGFSGNWVASARNTTNSAIRIRSGSLDYPNLATSGNSVLAVAQGNTISGASRVTSQSFMGAADQVSYMSFTIRYDEASTLFGGFGGIYVGNSGGHNQPKLFVGRGSTTNSTWQLETLGGTGVVSSDVTANLNETVLLVVKMQTMSGNDRFTLYVNPVGESEPSSGFVKTDLDLGTVDQISIYHAGGYQIDEIRIGTTFADVAAVPEPSSFALLTILIVAASGWHFRRQILATRSLRLA